APSGRGIFVLSWLQPIRAPDLRAFWSFCLEERVFAIIHEASIIGSCKFPIHQSPCATYTFQNLHPIGQPPVTWHPRQPRSMPVYAAKRSVNGGPPVTIGDQWWKSVTVADGGPPLTTIGPPVNDDMDLFAFIQVADLTKVKVEERERVEGEAKLLDSTARRVVSLLPVALTRADSELEAGVDRQAVTDASGSSYPPKKLRGDHETSSGVATGGKSSFILKELLASSILNVKAGVEAVATLTLVTSSVSATLERKSGALADSITGLNLRTIGPSKRFVISSDSFHHSSANAAEVKVISPVHASMFHDSNSTRTVRSDAVGSSHIPRNELSMGSRDINFETLHKVFVLERRRLESECEKQADLLKARDAEVESLKAQLLLKETEAMEAARAQVSVAEAIEKIHADEIYALKQRNVALENEKDSLDGKMNIINDKLAKLDADLLEMALHLEEKLYPHPLNTISGQRWLLTRDVKLAIVKCLNLQEYLTTLGSAISRAIEKGMQDGVSAGIDYEKAGRGLADIFAYNPATEVDYNSALQRLREVDFPLLAKLGSHKDASIMDIMDLLRLEGPLVDAPWMSNLQPDVEQLILPIHRPKDQVVLGENSLSFALSVAHSRVEKIRENVAAQRSTLMDVWAPLDNPLSAQNLIGEASTFGNVPDIVVATTALSTTFASTSSIPPITTDDYDIVNVDGQEDVMGNVASFPIVEFEKEEMDATLERDPPSGIYIVKVRGSCSPSRFLSLYAPMPNASVTSMSRLISKASSFCTTSTSAVLSVSMPIYAGMTASVPYVSEKGERSGYVNPSLVEWPWGCDWGQLLLRISWTPLITTNRCDLLCTALALFDSAGRVSSIRCPKIVDVIFHSVSAFLFSLLGICLIENILKPLASVLTFSNQEFDFMRTFQERSGYVNPSLVEWPWGCDWGQLLLRISWYRSVDLEILACPYQCPCILMHSGPILSDSQSFSHYGSCAYVHTTRSFLYLP
nr:hypothetical protein [Tanacetum cinerariifolium]